VHLDDQELLEIIQHGGIQKGGLVTEPLIWVGSGKYPKLTRLGSPTHKRYQLKESLSTKKPIKRKLLKIGSLYETQGEVVGVYLGQVNTVQFEEKPQYSNILVSKEYNNLMCWLEASPKVSDPKQCLAGVVGSPSKLISESTGCKIKLKASHTFKLNWEQASETPSDILKQVRNAYVQKLKDEAARGWVFSWGIDNRSKLFNMTPVNVPPSVTPDVKEAITRSGETILIDHTALSELPRLLVHKKESVRKAARKRAEELGATQLLEEVQ